MTDEWEEPTVFASDEIVTSIDNFVHEEHSTSNQKEKKSPSLKGNDRFGKFGMAIVDFDDNENDLVLDKVDPPPKKIEERGVGKELQAKAETEQKPTFMLKISKEKKEDQTNDAPLAEKKGGDKANVPNMLKIIKNVEANDIPCKKENEEETLASKMAKKVPLKDEKKDCSIVFPIEKAEAKGFMLRINKAEKKEEPILKITKEEPKEIKDHTLEQRDEKQSCLLKIIKEEPNEINIVSSDQSEAKTIGLLKIIKNEAKEPVLTKAITEELKEKNVPVLSKNLTVDAPTLKQEQKDLKNPTVDSEIESLQKNFLHKLNFNREELTAQKSPREEEELSLKEVLRHFNKKQKEATNFEQPDTKKRPNIAHPKFAPKTLPKKTTSPLHKTTRRPPLNKVEQSLDAANYSVHSKKVGPPTNKSSNHPLEPLVSKRKKFDAENDRSTLNSQRASNLRNSKHFGLKDKKSDGMAEALLEIKNQLEKLTQEVSHLREENRQLRNLKLRDDSSIYDDSDLLVDKKMKLLAAKETGSNR